MSNLPANATMALDYSRAETIETIRQTVAVNATPAELAMFLEFCKSTGLNPFKKEIWFIKPQSGRLQMMTGINGFYTIANKHPQYDGMEEPTYETDDKGQLLSVTVKVWRKDRRFPSVGCAHMAEYKQGTPIWREKPRTMLLKVAESIALRKAFPQELNGLYTAEEMPANYEAPKVEAPTLPAKQVTVTVDSDEAPEWITPPIPVDPFVAKVNEAIEAGDLWELESHIIVSECQKKGQTLGEVWTTDRAWYEAALTPKRKSKLHAADALAMKHYKIALDSASETSKGITAS